MRIATMATGGIGGFLAVKLTQAGHELATIARGAHLDAIRADGLTLSNAEGETLVRPWMATDDTAEIGPVDAVIFGVKAGGLDAAAEATRPLLGPDTLVIPFLNGVEAADRLAALLPSDNIANGVARVSTTVAAPGVIGQVGLRNRFIFAERDSRPSPRVEALAQAFRDAGVGVEVSDDIDRELWSKFVLFSGVSGVTAGARCRVGDIQDDPALGRLFQDLLAETAALARARGVAIPDDMEAQAWRIVGGLPREMRASTAIDLEKGAALETDWINGAVARLSEEAGLAAPANRAIAALLGPYRHGARA